MERKSYVECSICNARFENGNLLLDHLERGHIHPCDMCDTQCESTEALNDHKKMQHPSNRCAACDLEFCNQEELDEHNRIYHADLETNETNYHHVDSPQPSLYECGTCYGFFRTLSDLHRHVINYHHNRQLPSGLGYWPIGESLRLNEAKGVIIYICTFCDAKFSDEKSMKTHRLIHGFECPFCRAIFRNKIDIYLHLKKDCKNKNFDEGVVCPLCLCKKKFKSFQEFEWHCQSSHRDVTTHTGRCCNDLYRHASNLGSHVVTFRRNEQRRLISDGLVSDEENRKHTEQRVPGSVPLFNLPAGSSGTNRTFHSTPLRSNNFLPRARPGFPTASRPVSSTVSRPIFPRALGPAFSTVPRRVPLTGIRRGSSTNRHFSTNSISETSADKSDSKLPATKTQKQSYECSEWVKNLQLKLKSSLDENERLNPETSLCSSEFSKENDVNDPYVMDHYYCPYCHIEFQTTDEVSDHIKESHPNENN